MAVTLGPKSGVTSISEHFDRELITYKSVQELNAAWTEKLAQAMAEQKRVQKDPGDREAFAVMRSPAMREKYMSICRTIAKGLNLGWNDAKILVEWESVQQEAVGRYRTLLMRASAPPLPEPIIPAAPDEETEALVEVPAEEEPILTEGVTILLPASLDDARWADWGKEPLNNETIGKLNFEFANALANELGNLTDGQMRDVKEVYVNILRTMYQKTYPGAVPENVENSFEAYWVDVLSATRLIAPAVQSAARSQGKETS